MDEEARIARLRALVADDPRVRIGIGDDAAVLEDGTVLSVDASVEGTHFRRAFGTWRQLARRAVVAALSDLSAMGAEPVAILTSLTLPSDVDDEQLHRGVLDAAREAGAALIGGNLAAGPHVEIHTTVVGRAETPLRRRGANVGEGVFVTGGPGQAALGLHALLDGRTNAFRDAWLEPSVRVREGLALRGVASACIDVSDGLLTDLQRLCDASGVGADITIDALRSDAFVEACRAEGVEPDALILDGGEAYELLFTARVDPPFGVRIGEVVDGGLTVNGAAHEPAGFDHFTRK